MTQCQKLSLIFLFFLLFALNSKAQQSDSATAFNNDSTSLSNVTVTAFALQSKWKNAPAAIAVINKRDLQLLNNVSLVPVMNTVPGVRMEERSPGSYRFSIRGSLLRSPFGVRNVKVYWNDISLTDAGGNTYLQLIDINQLSSIEIIKGPASSLYGANTGGALILHSGNYFTPTKKNTFNASVAGGSFGLFNEQLGWKHSTANFSTNIQQSHQQSDGYRQQSAMRRDAIKWDGNWQITKKENLSFLTFYSDLYYQTPGGITQQQMDSLASLARPLAVTQKAVVYNRTAFAGVTLTSAFNEHFDNVTTLTANHTDFKNPAVLNYELRTEWNYNGRTTFSYHTEKNSYRLKWLAGIEASGNHSNIDDYGNLQGAKDSLQFKDELYATQYFVFTQLNIDINKFTLQAGISNNQQTLKYRRLNDPLQSAYQKTNSKNLLAPRLSILYAITNNASVYAVAAKGFSVPTIAEVHPSNGTFNNSLQKEFGWNYELGFKGSLINDRLLFDASLYYFNLKGAIVKRSTATNPEYYVNAGSTIQKGTEVLLKAFLVKNQNTFITSFAVSNSFSYQPYHFDAYEIAGTNYSGNKLTGVPRTINVNTLEVQTNPGFYLNLIYNHTSSLPLNDANNAFAKGYHLLQCKAGYQKTKAHLFFNLYAGADNLLNEVYSLGNDINAAGGRYFNPAPKRNFYAGVDVVF